MSSRVRKNQYFLKYLASCDKKQRVSCIKNAKPDEIKSLCECTLNFYNGNVNVKKEAIKKMTPYKTVLKKIASKKNKNTHLKSLLVQRGGAFIPILLATILPQLVNYLSSQK